MDNDKTMTSQVTFHYRGLLEDGTVFYDSTQHEPMQCELGKHMVMPQLEDALMDMVPGEQRTVAVGMAYGAYDDDALRKHILRSAIEDGDKICEGQELLWKSPQNPNVPIQAKIVQADEYTFDIDFNHPLAGKNISYEVNLLSIS